jgi:hypothetical protein
MSSLLYSSFCLRINIIIGRTAVFEPWPSLEDSAIFVYSLLCVVNQTIRFYFFGFRNSTFLQSKIVSLASNPPTWRIRCLYLNPQRQGGPGIPLGTRFPLLRLLRLAGPRWRHSKPPPHRNCLHILPSFLSSSEQLRQSPSLP